MIYYIYRVDNILLALFFIISSSLVTYSILKYKNKKEERSDLDYTRLNEAEYIELRLNNQINWFDHKSIKCQKEYKLWCLVQIILSAIIPIITIFPINKEYEWTITISIVACGSICSAISSYLMLSNSHDLWIKYRTACELLKKEKSLYLTNSSTYGTNPLSNFNKFVHRIEEIIATENNQWNAIMNESNNTSKTSTTKEQNKAHSAGS